MSKGILITITPDGRRKDKRIDRAGGPSLGELQEATGGYIEKIQVKFGGVLRDAYVDKESPMKGGKLNPYATTYFQEAHPERRVKALRGNIAIWIPDDPKVSRLQRSEQKRADGFPKLEFSDHCSCCARNKITLEVFGKSADAPDQTRVD